MQENIEIKAERIREIVKSENIRNIYLNFIDLNGNIRSKLVGVKELINNTHVSWNDGISINGRLITDFKNNIQSDWLVLLPDADSFRIIPFLEESQKSAMLMCQIKNFSLDSRDLLKKAVNQLYTKEKCIPVVGTELIYEFTCSGQDYYHTLPTSSSTIFNNSLVDCLLESKIDVEYYMPYGKKHNRIDLVPDIATNSADKYTVSKWFLRSLATKVNYDIKFSKLDENSLSSFPMHISLWDENKKNNLFFSNDDEFELSNLAKKFINGILHFNKYIYAVTKATTKQEMLNLIPTLSMNRDNSLIQVPLYFKEKQKKDRVGWSKRLVYQGATSDCNHYLVLACILYAGIFGLQNLSENEKHMECVNQYSCEELLQEVKNNEYFIKTIGGDFTDYIINKLNCKKGN